MTHVRMLACAAAAVFLAVPGRGQDYDKALLRVHLPADAKLEIQGQGSKKTGAVRLFESTLLPPGKAFLYDLKATWTENGKTSPAKRPSASWPGRPPRSI